AYPYAADRFYVNDADTTDDEYTTAPGSNRNTGKLADRPKPYPNNVLRIYTLGANQTLLTDTGSYALFDPTVVSETAGIGDDEGFVWTGPTGEGRTAELWHANPLTVASLIELNDADLVTIRHLTLDNELRGLWVHNGSSRFTGEYLSVSGHSEDGILIEGSIAQDTEFTQLHYIVAQDNGRHGIYVDSPIDAVTDSLVGGNAQRGIYLTNQEGLLLADNVVHDNGSDGIYYKGAQGQQTTISGNTVHGNERGIYVTTTTNDSAVTITGNEVFDNRDNGIEAIRHVLVSLNSVYDNAESGIHVTTGGEAVENVVFGNAVGIQLGGWYNSATARRNRVYDNALAGIEAHYASLAEGNVVYSNLRGVVGLGSFQGIIANNLVYINTNEAILLDKAGDPELFGNTIYQQSGAGVRIENNSSGVNLRNNIIRVDAGYGISVANDSQSGFQSDFNLLLATGTGNVGLWQDADRRDLAAWRNAAFTDQSSIDQDPL
ncbi:hypothetical protein LCGC14_2526520, partial [marine sediment metagenome]